MIRMHLYGDGWNFIIWEEKGKLKWQFFAGIFTEGFASIDKSEQRILEDVLDAHYKPRVFRSLQGIEKTYEPLYDDPRQFPAAFRAKKRLEGLTSQRELFTS